MTQDHIPDQGDKVPDKVGIYFVMTVNPISEVLCWNGKYWEWPDGSGKPFQTPLDIIDWIQEDEAFSLKRARG